MLRGDSMHYSHFGELLKEIRKTNNITLEQLADGICSVRQLSRIERGENNPSLYILHNISIKLNIDLQEYYRIHFSSGSFEAYDYKSKLEQLLINLDLHGVRELVEKVENLVHFKNGENRQYIIYGKALCSANLDKDYELSNNLCIEGLLIEDPSFNINEFEDKIYSNIGLTMINLLAVNYNRMEQYEKSFKIFQSLFLVLENHIFNAPFSMYNSLVFEKKLYQSTSCNLSIMYSDKDQYEIASEYVSKGISFSIKENYMRFLPELLAQKSRLLYKMGHTEDSHIAYQDCLSLYRLCRGTEQVEKIETEIEEKFNK